MTEIYTSHWRSPLLAEVDAAAVSLSRGRPRWPLPFSYRRYDALAPSDEAWREQETEAFAAAYVGQLERLGSGTIVSELERIGGGRPVVCLCWEKPGEPFCHRWVLSRWLHDQTGIVIPELETGMLPQRDDVAERRLF